MVNVGKYTGRMDPMGQALRHFLHLGTRHRKKVPPKKHNKTGFAAWNSILTFLLENMHPCFFLARKHRLIFLFEKFKHITAGYSNWHGTTQQLVFVPKIHSWHSVKLTTIWYHLIREAGCWSNPIMSCRIKFAKFMQFWILQLHEQPVLNHSVCSWRFHNSAFRLEATPQNQPTSYAIPRIGHMPHPSQPTWWKTEHHKLNTNSKNTCEKNHIPNQGFPPETGTIFFPKRKFIYTNHPFSGVNSLFVSGRVFLSSAIPEPQRLQRNKPT